MRSMIRVRHGRNFHLKSGGGGYKNSTCAAGMSKFLKFSAQNGAFSAVFGNENRCS